jgi:hypothetical protein
VDEPDQLELGADGPRFSLPRKWAVLLLVGAVLLAAGGLLVDRSLRQREERAVTACAREVAAAVDVAGSRLHAAYTYVRPALDSDPSRALRQGLYGVVAESAQGAGSDLAGVRTRCSQVHPLALHTELRQRVDRCVEVLDQQTRGLAAVARDGQQVLQWMDAPSSC